MTFPITVAGATRTGRRHEKEGLPNQDNFRYKTLSDKHILVAAVSDGAGSASKSAYGSLAAVVHAVNVAFEELARDHAPEQALRSGLQAAITAVHKMADRDPTHDINSYHATLVLAAWTPHGIAAIQVGDGAAIVITEDGPKMLTIPQQGEYANETYFITMPQARDIAFFNQTESAHALSIFTDGLQQQAVDFTHRRPHPEFITDAIKAPAHEDVQPIPDIISNSWSPNPTPPDQLLQAWLQAKNVAQLNLDDTTLIVASKITHDF